MIAKLSETAITDNEDNGNSKKSDIPKLDGSNERSETDGNLKPEYKLSDFVMKGLSLGYDLSTVLLATQYVTSSVSMSKFIQILIDCEEEKRIIKSQVQSVQTNKYTFTTCSRTNASLLIIDAIDTILTYYKEDDDDISMEPVRIAYKTLKAYNLGECKVIITDTRNMYCCHKGDIHFLQELHESGNVISIDQSCSKSFVTSLLDMLVRRSIIFSNGYSNFSIAKYKTDIKCEKIPYQIDFATFHFNNDHFIVDDIIPLSLGDNGRVNNRTYAGSFHFRSLNTPNSQTTDDLCPYGAKCTYGTKCKYYHPERKIAPQLSLIDELMQKAVEEKSKLEQTVKQDGSLSAIVLTDQSVLTEDLTKSLNDQTVGRFQVIVSGKDNYDRQYTIPNQRDLSKVLKYNCFDNETGNRSTQQTGHHNLVKYRNRKSLELSSIKRISELQTCENNAIDSTLDKVTANNKCHYNIDCNPYHCSCQYYANEFTSKDINDSRSYPTHNYFTWTGFQKPFGNANTSLFYKKKQHRHSYDKPLEDDEYRYRFPNVDNTSATMPVNTGVRIRQNQFNNLRGVESTAFNSNFINYPTNPYATIQKNVFISHPSINNGNQSNLNHSSSLWDICPSRRPNFKPSSNNYRTNSQFHYGPNRNMNINSHKINSNTQDNDSLTHSISPYSLSSLSSQGSGIDISSNITDRSYFEDLRMTSIEHKEQGPTSTRDIENMIRKIDDTVKINKSLEQSSNDMSSQQIKEMKTSTV